MPLTATVAYPGRGLEGDRYYHGQGSFSRWPGPHRELTLIAEEDLARIEAESGITLAPELTRRNLLTRGVPLHELIKEEFRIGSVSVRGERKCQPCKYLARLLGEKHLVAAMVHKGGLRARILDEGAIRVGDPITPA